MNEPDDLPRSRREGCASDLVLDSHLANEPTIDAGPVRAHLDTCVRCRTRLAAIEADRSAFRARAAPQALAPTAMAKVLAFRRRGNVAGALGALAAAAVIVLVVTSGDDDGSSRRKGRGELTVYVNHDGVVRRGADGEVVHPGDRLRFAVTLEAARYIAVLSRDGAGNHSVYFPAAGPTPRFGPGERIALPLATELDDVLGTEQLSLLTCDAPLDLAELRGVGSAPAGCVKEELRIEKRKRPEVDR